MGIHYRSLSSLQVARSYASYWTQSVSVCDWYVRRWRHNMETFPCYSFCPESNPPPPPPMICDVNYIVFVGVWASCRTNSRVVGNLRLHNHVCPGANVRHFHTKCWVWLDQALWCGVIGAMIHVIKPFLYNNNNNNLYLYSALIQFVSKALYNEVHNMHRKHKSNKKTLLPISKLLISGVIYHGKLG